MTSNSLNLVSCSNLLTCLIVTIEIEPVLGTAIRGEIDSIAVPHRKGVAVLGVRDHGIHNIVFDVVDSDVLCQTARIPLPLPEVAENPVVSHLRSIGRKGKEATFVHRHRLRQSAIKAHRVWTFRPTVRCVTSGEEYHIPPIRSPTNYLIENSHAVAKRLCGSLIISQLLWLAALRRHDIDVEIPVILSRKREPFAIRRKFREKLASGVRGNTTSDSLRNWMPATNLPRIQMQLCLCRCREIATNGLLASLAQKRGRRNS